jgi:hypothetical protein
MTAVNLWNKKIYEIIEIKRDTVRLKRPDREIIEIAKSEYYFSYRMLKD